MTVPLTNWCSTCEEACHDHSTICTVCGDTLQEPPNNNNTNTNNNARRPPPPSFSLSLGSALGVPEANQELLNLLQQQQQQQQQQRRGGGAIGSTTTGADQDEWQTVPAELLDPQQQRVTSSRPTSQETLDHIPRILLESQSSLLHQPTLKIKYCSSSSSSSSSSSNSPPPQIIMETMTGVVGEFGIPPHSQNNNNNNNNNNHQNKNNNNVAVVVKDAALVVAHPLTGKGGTVSSKTLTQIQTHQRQRSRIILYMERGDGITFVQKAILAQTLGADALVVGNNTTKVWPYIMKDSKGEALTQGLKIPVIMVKMQDGKRLEKLQQQAQHHQQQLDPTTTNNNNNGDGYGCLSTTLEIESSFEQECVICRDTFAIGQTLMRLPLCGHVFHESCGLAWLCKNNTCPYCRRELPTDDVEYEQERRRQQRTHAGSWSVEGTDVERGGHVDFYG